MGYQVLVGDSAEVLRGLPENSIDAVVCDPPYGLSKEPDMAEVLRHWLAGDDYKHSGGGFMGKAWDSFVPGPALWREVFRVLKPGGHLLAFAGSRTYDLMAVAIRLAGFEIRDQMQWIFASGFPKSLNLDHLRGEKTCGCEEAEQEAEHYVRLVRASDIPPAINASNERGEVLQQSMPEQGSPAEGQQLPSDARSAEPGMEGRRDVSEAARQLRAGEIHTRAGACAAYDTKRRLRDGTPLGDGGMDRANTAANGSGSPHGSRSDEQRAGEPGTMAGQSQPQAVGAWPLCGRCRLPRVPSGLGTALKPAHEPVVVARKPLEGTVAANVLKWGTGALNIDGCRVGTESTRRDTGAAAIWGRTGRVVGGSDAGRWPANVIHDGSDEVTALFPQTTSGGGPKPGTPRTQANTYGKPTISESAAYGSNTGSAARFFYCAKASRSERNAGLEHLPELTGGQATDRKDGSKGLDNPRAGAGRTGGARNIHPTVKPIALMRYLCRLVTPPGGTVLDPFMGSGSTGCAAVQEGFNFVGVEMDPEYLEIARARIAHWNPDREPEPANDNTPDAKPDSGEEQLDLLAGTA